MPTDYSTMTATSNTLDVTIWFFLIILFIIILFLVYYFLNKSIKKGTKNKEVAVSYTHLINSLAAPSNGYGNKCKVKSLRNDTNVNTPKACNVKQYVH